MIGEYRGYLHSAFLSTVFALIICDRHGEEIDPFVKLRRDIVQCFTTNKFGAPLTYTE